MYKWEWNDQTTELFNKAIEDMWDDNPKALSSICSTNLGHSNIHIQNINNNVFERIIKDENIGECYFENKDEANDWILNAICSAKEEIINWMQGSEIDVCNKMKHIKADKNTFDLIINAYESVGIGYMTRQTFIKDDGSLQTIPYIDGNIHKVDCHYIHVVLHADANHDEPRYSRFGFVLETAYPADINGESKELDIISRKDAAATLPETTYMQRTYFIFKGLAAKYPNIHIFLQNASQDNPDQKIRAEVLDINKKPIYVAYLDPRGIKYREFTPNGMKKHILPEQIKDKNFVDVVNQAMDCYISIVEEDINVIKQSQNKAKSQTITTGLNDLIKNAKEDLSNELGQNPEKSIEQNIR